MRHFTPFGKVTSLTMQDDGDSALVTFATRIFAERVSYFVLVCLLVLQKKPIFSF